MAQTGMRVLQTLARPWRAVKATASGRNDDWRLAASNGRTEIFPGMQNSGLGRVPGGGLALPRNKPGLSAPGTAIETLPLPQTIILPLLDYQRRAIVPLVKCGQTVNRGDPLAAGLIASVSGRITAIEPRPLAHPSGRSEQCVVIAPHDSIVDDSAVFDAIPELDAERLDLCGVTGLGGAGFSTAEKLRAAQRDNGYLELLLINAVECEPMISCDEALMISDAATVVRAIRELAAATRCRRCVLAVESDKHQALLALREALDAQDPELTRDGQATRSAPVVELLLIEPVYPSGAERLLIERVSGVRLDSQQRPATGGILCINVATAVACHHARLGIPHTTRIVTLAGDAACKPMNARVALGTPIGEVIRLSGNAQSAASLPAMPSVTHSGSAALDTVPPAAMQIRIGGPLSGFDLTRLDAPVTATVNSIIVRQACENGLDRSPTQPCIRCNACSDVCPVGLLPQQLYWHAQAEDLRGADRYGIDECIECACCDIVCPSHIGLTQLFRHAKSVKRDRARQEAMAAASRQRHARHEQRQLQRDQARRERRRLAQERLATSEDPIAAALARSRRRRNPGGRRKPASKGNPSDGAGSS